MKVALVHELLTMKGGAERVLRVLADMFPNAPIYTLLYDEKKLGDWFPRERVRTSNQQPATSNPLPSSVKWNHHLYFSRFPAAVEAWDFSAFDLVISSSSAFVHGIITNGKPKHIALINSPARYLWDRTHDVLERASHGMLGPLKRAYLEHVFHKLRIWDCESAARADILLAASKEVQRRIELYWRRESTVLYPPIDDFWINGKTAQPSKPRNPANYFIVVSTLVPYKRIDLAITACSNLGIKLKIVGEGPDRSRLQKLASPTVEFLGYRPMEELRELYANAAATIVPGDEDFNLVALESMACGTPVIAFASGGPLETVIEGTTGTFFREPTAASLERVIKGFDRQTFCGDACRERSLEFSTVEYKRKLQGHIDALMQR
jgi:glycosyltransferase involved in cell wall biosynthesis